MKADEIQKQKVQNAVENLIDILGHYEVHIGASAMICLLIQNAQASKIEKKEWIRELEEIWEFYLSQEIKQDF